MYLEEGSVPPADADPLHCPTDADPIPPGCRPPSPCMQIPSPLDADSLYLDTDPFPLIQTPCIQIQTMLGSQPPFPVHAGISNGYLTKFP